MAPDTEIRVVFDQEKKDIITFGFIQQKRSQYGQFFGSNWAFVILGVLALYLGYHYIWQKAAVEYGVVIAFVCYSLYLLSFHSKSLYGLLFWPQLKRSKMAVRGPVEILLNRENITVRATSSEQVFTWRHFDACVASTSYLFLFCASGNGILFPKRAFLLDQEAYDFVTYIQHNLEINNK